MKINIGNYCSIADILKILKEKGIEPEDASIDVSAYENSDSYGNTFMSIDVELDIIDRKK